MMKSKNKYMICIYSLVKKKKFYFYLIIFFTDNYYLIKIVQTDSNQYFKAFIMTTTYYIGLEICI